MRFSVIIPTYNRARLLPAALDSVLAQPGGDYEVIVADDGSTDDTTAVLAPYAARVTVVRQENRGPGAARNLGLRHARGSYVAFLDSDDLWLPWTLGTYRRAVDAHTPAFLAGTHLDLHDGGAALPAVSPEYREEVFADYLATAARAVWIGTCGAVIRRDALDAAGGFPGQRVNAEDSDLWLRLGTASKFVWIASPAVFAYRRHAASAVADLHLSYLGMSMLIAQEDAGRYPGGDARRRERQEIITRHTRPASLACIQRGDAREGWDLYRRTFGWNLRLGRLRYLLGSPLLALARGRRAGIKP